MSQISQAAAAGQGEVPEELFVRSNAWELDADDPIVTFYAQAVAAMRALPDSDPSSWTHQAAIHGTYASPPPQLANSCKHGTWYFVAWHRMYAYRFEQIVRGFVVAAGGPAGWALPYWDYGAGGEQATIPLAFRDPQLPSGEDNPLYVAERADGINDGAALPPQITSAAKALACPQFTGTTQFGGGETPPTQQFYSQTGQLEHTPHNDVHNAVGGPDGWMSDPDTAAQDPVFWLHHSNIDRLWWTWDPDGARSPPDRSWEQQPFDLYDPTGTIVPLRCIEVRDVAADLGYTYLGGGAPATPAERLAAPQEEPMPSPPEGEPEIVGATEKPITLRGAPVGVTVQVDAKARSGLLADAKAKRPARALLTVDDVEARRNPGTVYGVYVNLPDDPGDDDLEAHHAGNVSFFGIERARDPRADEPAHGMRLVFEITQLLDALAARGAWDGDKLDVSFRPLGLIAPQGKAADALRAPSPTTEDPPVTIGRVGLFYG